MGGGRDGGRDSGTWTPVLQGDLVSGPFPDEKQRVATAMRPSFTGMFRSANDAGASVCPLLVAPVVAGRQATGINKAHPGRPPPGATAHTCGRTRHTLVTRTGEPETGQASRRRPP